MGFLPSPGPDWAVIQNVESTGKDSTGSYVKGRSVTFQLASGTAGTVFVPDAALTPDSVKAAINAAAARIAAVDGLTSGS